MPHQIPAKQTPLDTLLISQIAEIRKRESALQERLNHLVEPTQKVSFAEEVWHLQQCADRLNRMIDAMRGYSGQMTSFAN